MPRYAVHKKGVKYAYVSWDQEDDFPFNCGYLPIGDLLMWEEAWDEKLSGWDKRKINLLVLKKLAEDLGTSDCRRIVFSDNKDKPLYKFGKQFDLLVGGASKGNHGAYTNYLGSVTPQVIKEHIKKSTEGWELIYD